MKLENPGFDVPLTSEETVFLLGRDLVSMDLAAIRPQSILVTGAAGSIGREMVLRFLRTGHQVVALDKSEKGLFQLQQTCSELGVKNEPVYLVLNLGDYHAVGDVFENHSFTTVVHCAAHKHVGLMEANEEECRRNNLDHTLHLYSQAVRNTAKQFVFLSTDKAVNATCVMGRAKAEAEKKLEETKTRAEDDIVLSIVRLPNVMGSDGSVAQIFRRQVKLGNPLTVTDRWAERLFISSSYACDAIESTLAYQLNGTIVPTEHTSIKILDLAHRAHALWGQEEDEPEIVFTQLGEGERLREFLVSATEEMSSWVVPQLGVLNRKVSPSHEG